MTVREAIRRSMALLTSRDRKLFSVAVAIQMATSTLDLVGVLLIGFVGALSVLTIQSQPLPPSLQPLTEVLGIADWPPQDLVILLAALAAAVLLLKSVSSSFLTRRVLIFLANRQALVSARLSAELLSRPLTEVQRRSSQETSFALITGAGMATMAILGQLSIAATEAALLAVLSVALLVVSPWAAIFSIAFFFIIALSLQRAMGNWAARVGQASSQADITSLNLVQEVLGAYREVTVMDRREFYVDRIQSLRWQAAKVTAEGQFITMFPKYLFEVALVIGGLALAGALFATQDSAEAVGTLALFLAAATRVMPSLLRLQGAALSLRAAAGSAAPTFELASELGSPTKDTPPTLDAEQVRHVIERGHPDFVQTVEMSDVSFQYVGSIEPSVVNISLDVRPGQSVALVGRSGAGKSTLVDLLLGVLIPDEGEIRVGGEVPARAIARWPGAISYVPQTIALATDTIRANVALGLPRAAVDDRLVWEALERAHLAGYLREHREGLDTFVGEKGLRLSGGERQRLGIARALFTRPKLLVLDEATSALDADTELAVSRMIGDLSGDVTVFMIAHRLATVRSVDLVVYLDQGRVIATGSFDEVRRQVPDLERQAALMGLS